MTYKVKIYLDKKLFSSFDFMSDSEELKQIKTDLNDETKQFIDLNEALVQKSRIRVVTVKNIK